MVIRWFKVTLTCVALIWVASLGYGWQLRMETGELPGNANSARDVAVSPIDAPLQSLAPADPENELPKLPIPTSSILSPVRLVFPVKQHDLSHVISVYGDQRGRRLHQGIDIKAERGTPVLAVTEGTIERVKEGGNGGKQIYLRGKQGRLFYYAHLDSWAVEESETVRAGQELGGVGDSGNARNTTPHLHFEILLGEDKDAVDPLPYFLHNP